MSPRAPDQSPMIGGFPRVSGDEPFFGVEEDSGLMFSPRERG